MVVTLLFINARLITFYSYCSKHLHTNMQPLHIETNPDFHAQVTVIGRSQTSENVPISNFMKTCFVLLDVLHIKNMTHDKVTFQNF